MSLNLQSLLENQGNHPTLVVDSRRCRYSSELNKEISRTDVSSAIRVVDIGTLTGDDIKKISWLPGVPVLVSEEHLYLGVDAFRRSREVVRTALLKGL